MHRLSCFRDDLIFVIYLYQRWIYRVDKTRGQFATERPEIETSETDKTLEIDTSETDKATEIETSESNKVK